MRRDIGALIATREYFRVGDERRSPVVEVAVAAPVRSMDSPQDEFSCSFRIRLGGAERTETVYGIDPLQALVLALGYLRVSLARLEGFSELRWAGGASGDSGIQIPAFGDDLQF